MIEWPPSQEALFDLPIDELGIGLLQNMVIRGHRIWNRAALGSNEAVINFGYNRHDRRVRQQLVEIFDWLNFQGYLAHDPDQAYEWYYITERGRAAASDSNSRTTLRATKLLANELHPRIEKRVRSQFLLGEYEAAVLMAFREVEIRVRDLGGFNAAMIGVSLMRKAFSPKDGKLIDTSLEAGEQQAMMDLFAGAIGTFKNPSSHRQVDYSDATIAAEAVLFADLLLRMLDRYDPALMRS